MRFILHGYFLRQFVQERNPVVNRGLSVHSPDTVQGPANIVMENKAQKLHDWKGSYWLPKDCVQLSYLISYWLRSHRTGALKCNVIFFSLLSIPTNAQHIYINNIVYIVSTATCFNAFASSSWSFLILLFC